MSYTTVKLDPAAVATGRAELAIHQPGSGQIALGESGPDWGDAAIAAVMAELQRGELPANYRVPNRVVKLPLVLGSAPRDDVAYANARKALQQKVALFQAEGGWLQRGSLYADVVDAALTFPDRYSRWSVEGDLVLTLHCLPDFYGDEVALNDHIETTLPELTFTDTGVAGDYPARLRLVIDNDQAVLQRGLLVGVRCRNYSSAATARLAYEAEALTPLDVAATTALSGASGAGSNTVRHNSLSTSWGPVLSTNLASDGSWLTHKGSYRVWARVYTTSASLPSVRLAWDVGDLANPEQNDAWTFPAANAFYLADLGEIRLDAVPVGNHRWQGQLQAKGPAGGENVYVDRLFLIPLDEGAVKLSAPSTSVSGLSSPVERDEFNQTAGALAGKAASVGGNWAGAGSATDFTVDATNHRAIRSAVSDTQWAGRYATLAATFTDLTVAVDTRSTVPWGSAMGVLARYIDTNNWLMALVTVVASTAGTIHIQLYKRVGGVVTQLADVDTRIVPDYDPSISPQMGSPDRVTLTVGADGTYKVYQSLGAGAGLGNPAITGSDPVLATGGALASGKAGFYDEATASTARTAAYDNFYVSVPAYDAITFASLSVQVGNDGNVRQSSDGAAWGQVSIQTGDLLRLPPAGLEARTVEVIAKLSRGDFDQIPDAGIDDLSAKAYYRPCYLFPYS